MRAVRVITQNGKAAGVPLSPAKFDRLSERARFVSAVQEGLADADAGELRDHEDVVARMRARSAQSARSERARRACATMRARQVAAILDLMIDGTNVARRIQVEHERIVEELAALPESERRAIVLAADEEARRRARAVASWDTIESLTSLVHVGGDAVEDCWRACEP